MNSFVVAIIAIILSYVYISYYYRYPENIKILNAYEKNFNTTLLLEKQPIILLDNPYPTLTIAKEHILPYLFSKKIDYIPLVWNKNPSKYLFITTDKDTEIHLLPASKKLHHMQPSPEDVLITLQIVPSQIVILPFHWHYYSSSDLNILGIDDYITWALP
jgi:hypothetical protein